MPPVAAASPGGSLLLLEDMETENRKFMDNMRWMYEHVRDNADNPHHIQALHLAFGKPLEEARDTIEVELSNVAAASSAAGSLSSSGKRDQAGS